MGAVIRDGPWTVPVASGAKASLPGPRHGLFVIPRYCFSYSDTSLLPALGSAEYSQFPGHVPCPPVHPGGSSPQNT